MRNTLFFLIIITTLHINAQSKYIIGVNGGIVTSQINGDGYGGFRKYGLSGGLSLLKNTEEDIKWVFELNYISKGSRQKPDFKNGIVTDYKHYLSYLELSPLYTFPRFGVNFEVGPSLSYLINSTEEYQDIPSISQNKYRNFEIGGILGVNFEIQDQLMFFARYSQSITPLRTPPLPSGTIWLRVGEYHNVISVGLKYFFSNPNFNWGYSKPKIKVSIED